MSVLEVINVSRSFDGVHAVEEASLGFERSKITALIGPNGAGKTTVFNLISGLLGPDSGSIRYRGRDITGLAPWRIATMGVGRLFQDVRLFKRMSVLENVVTGFGSQTGEKVLRSVMQPWRVLVQERQLRARAMELLEFVGLAEMAENSAEGLSHGQQKLVAIARLLAADADVLMLDEPTSGVHADMVARILDTIRKLAHEGRTVIIIEHNLSVVAEISDWIYFMNGGQVVSFGLPADVLGDPDVRSAYIGIKAA